MTRLGSFKSQAPSSREVPSPKPQRAARDSHHIARALVWSLRFGASLELGVWCFGARRISIENSEEPREIAEIARLRQDCFHHFAGNISQAKVATLIAVG